MGIGTTDTRRTDRTGIRPFLGSWRRERFLGFGSVFLVYALYFPLTKYTLSLEPVGITTAFDHAIVLSPVWIVAYAMIYPAAILPVFVVKDPLVFRRVMMAYIGLELIAMLLFIICPVHMTIRPPIDAIQGTDFFSWGLRFCFWADHPTCCFPSLHVATAVLSALSCWRVDRRIGLGAGIVALLISASTLLIKQHFVYDVIAGGGLAFFFYFVWVQNAKALDHARLACARWWLSLPIAFFVLLMTVFFVLFQLGWEPWLTSGAQ
jgi:membrane-associated phospholipid phosphatase